MNVPASSNPAPAITPATASARFQAGHISDNQMIPCATTTSTAVACVYAASAIVAA